MTTLGAMADQLIRKSGSGIKIPSGSFSLSSSTTVTSTDYLRNGGYSNNSFQNWFQFRPTSASSADYIRRISSLDPSTGIYTINASVADTTAGSEDIYLLPPWMHPQRIIDSANFALEKNYVANIEPISTKPVGTGLSDAGFQSSSTSNYTASGTTFSKHTTANSERVFQGFGSGRTLNAGYIYQQFAVTPNETVNAWAAVSVAVGTATLTLRDATNSVTLGSVVSATGRDWQWMRATAQIPATCTLLEVRWGVTGTTDDAYWGGQNVLFPMRSRSLLDTKWESTFKAARLVAMRPAGVTSTNGVYQANTGDMIPIPESDYEIYTGRAGPNPTEIYWKNGSQTAWAQYPIFIDGRRSYADFTTALTLASWATDVPGLDKDLWDACTRLELFSMDDILAADSNNARKLARAQYDFNAVNAQFRQSNTTDGRVFRNFGYARN